MDKKEFKHLIRECIEEILQESLSKKPAPLKVRKGSGLNVQGSMNLTTRIHGQGKQSKKPKYDRKRDQNWKKDLDEGDEQNPLYVEYLKPMTNETPFMMGGEKFEYCWAKYPNGKVDIGVYAYRGDMCYGYNAFRERYNLSEDKEGDEWISRNVNTKPKGWYAARVHSNTGMESWAIVQDYTSKYLTRDGQWGRPYEARIFYSRDEAIKFAESIFGNSPPVNEMTGTSAVQGFYGKNWVDPDPKRKRMKSIAAKSVGGKVT